MYLRLVRCVVCVRQRPLVGVRAVEFALGFGVGELVTGTSRAERLHPLTKRSLERLRNIVCHERVTANLYSLQTLSNELCVKHLVVR